MDEMKAREIQEIESFALLYRRSNGIRDVGREWLTELSTEAYPGGEIGSLLFRQLVNTEFGFGAWSDLNDQKIRALTLEMVRHEVAACKQ